MEIIEEETKKSKKKYDTKKYFAKYYKKMKGGEIYNKIIAKNSFNYMMKRYDNDDDRQKYLSILQIKNPSRYEQVKNLYSQI